MDVKARESSASMMFTLDRCSRCEQKFSAVIQGAEGAASFRCPHCHQGYELVYSSTGPRE